MSLPKNGDIFFSWLTQTLHFSNIIYLYMHTLINLSDFRQLIYIHTVRHKITFLKWSIYVCVSVSIKCSYQILMSSVQRMKDTKKKVKCQTTKNKIIIIVKETVVEDHFCFRHIHIQFSQHQMALSFYKYVFSAFTSCSISCILEGLINHIFFCSSLRSYAWVS